MLKSELWGVLFISVLDKIVDGKNPNTFVV
jgi:hypothetical protein